MDVDLSRINPGEPINMERLRETYFYVDVNNHIEQQNRLGDEESSSSETGIEEEHPGSSSNPIEEALRQRRLRWREENPSSESIRFRTTPSVRTGIEEHPERDFELASRYNDELYKSSFTMEAWVALTKLRANQFVPEDGFSNSPAGRVAEKVCRASTALNELPSPSPDPFSTAAVGIFNNRGKLLAEVGYAVNTAGGIVETTLRGLIWAVCGNPLSEQIGHAIDKENYEETCKFLRISTQLCAKGTFHSFVSIFTNLVSHNLNIEVAQELVDDCIQGPTRDRSVCASDRV